MRPEESPLAPEIMPLFSAIADPDRIKIAAAIMDRALTADEIAAAAGMPVKAVRRKLAGLIQVDLVEIGERNGKKLYRFRMQPLFDAMRSLSEKPAGPDLDGDVDAFDRKVLTDFLEDGRLKAIPAQQKKRDAILRYLVERFEPERMYAEKEVNEIIRPVHDDVASLRRYLVDGGFLTRQIIREVDARALMAGTLPKVDHTIMYWKPPPMK
jgi:hypothetical protein